MQEFSANLHVMRILVPAQVVADRRRVLPELLGIIGAGAHRVARECELRREGHADRRRVVPVVVEPPRLDLLHDVAVHHARPVHGGGMGVAPELGRIRRVEVGRHVGPAAAEGAERVEVVVPGEPERQVVLAGELMVDAHQVAVMGLRVAELDAVAIRRRRDEEGGWLPFVLVGAEEVRLVLHDWPADRESDLLVLQRENLFCDEVGRVEPAVSEIAVKGAAKFVRARARDRLHLEAD